MIKEIGSEFWNAPGKYADIKYLLSGRTALEYIIREILSQHKIESVLLPSYCCHTMIEPFVRNGIPVRFYDIYFDEVSGLCADIPKAKDNEIFYYIEYFGFLNIQGISSDDIRRQWKIIIDDSTHSWMSIRTIGFNMRADYRYVSFRKWAGFDAISIAISENNQFYTDINENTNQRYCDIRNKAFKLKNAYICGDTTTKEDFLTLFNEAERVLENDYVGYRPSIDTIERLLNFDATYVRKKRQKNALTLISDLDDISDIQLIYEKIEEGETPLFVPILVPEKRDGLRKFLIDNQIYCPVHWPLSEYHKGLSQRGKSIYAMELSLVCDQRYGEDDMKRIAGLIRQYFSEVE